MRLVLGIRYTSKKIYNFIQNLIKNGAKVEMTYEYEVSGYGLKTEQLDMKSLCYILFPHVTNAHKGKIKGKIIL